MDERIDFQNYRYFYDGAIFRRNRVDGKYERLYNGEFKPIFPKRDFDERLIDGFDELSELFESSSRDMDLLKREIEKSNPMYLTEPHNSYKKGNLYFDDVELTEEYKKIEKKVETEIKLRHLFISKKLGYVHHYWECKRKILHRYGIEWRSPAEMNPRIIFD